jgi:hypothetical protein
MTAERLEFLETIREVEADGASIRAAFTGLMDRGDGMRIRSRSAQLDAGIKETGALLRGVMEGKRRWYVLKEAMTTSDFPLYLAGIIDRGMLGRYQQTPKLWPRYCARRTVRDFRPVDEYAIDGLEAVLDKVEQQTEYPEAALSETRYQWTIGKYGRRVPYSFESYVNDDLDMFATIPDRLARAAARSEDKFATGLHVDASGPHASMYTSGNKNIINATNAGAGFTAVNPALTISGLQEGFAVLANAKDADGEPIAIEAVILEVPPALEVAANNILNATELWIINETGTPTGGTSGQQLHVANWMRARTTLIVNPYIPIIASTANGNTSWFLHASADAGRPAFRMGFLRGFEAPGLYVKSPNARRAGGGDVDPFEGDFDTDTIEQKVRAFFGGTRLDPKSTVASNGSGS